MPAFSASDADDTDSADSADSAFQGTPGTSPAAALSAALHLLRNSTQTLAAWSSRHPTRTDTIVAAAALLLNALITHLVLRENPSAPSLPGLLTSAPLIVVIWAVCATCLALRRRHPVASWLVLLLVYLCTDWLLELLGTRPEEHGYFYAAFNLLVLLGLPITLGTVATHCRQLVTWTTWGVSCLANLLVLAVQGYSLRSPVLWEGTLTVALVLLVAVLVGLNLRSARTRLTELRIRSSRQALAREQSALLAASTERSRIAREMHDVVAHSLAVMITMADGAAATIDRDPATAKQALEMLAESGRSALADTRRLVGVLREDPALSREGRDRGTGAVGASAPASAPSGASTEPLRATGRAQPVAAAAAEVASLHQGTYDKARRTRRAPGSSPAVRDLPVPAFAPPGTVAAVEPSAQIADLRREATSDHSDSSTGSTPLAPAPEQADIGALVDRFRGAGVPVTYTWSGRTLPDDKGLQLSVFRIAQEALTNILRYAPTSPQVTVTVERHTGAVVLTVDNDSAPGSRPMHGSGKGLIGMRERAAVYGGTVQAGPTATGWRVRAVLRWEETEEGTTSWQMPL